MTDTPRIRPFADWLREHNGGRTHDELGETLHTLTARVNDTGRKGSITLTISVEPMKNAEGMIVVSDKITTKMWFTDDEGNLVRNDPRQLSFDSLREVPPVPGVHPTTGEVTDAAALADHDKGVTA
jgi:hypothetical protein